MERNNRKHLRKQRIIGGAEMIIEINEEQLYKHWNKDTIEKISSEKNMSFLETVIYLWLYNNVSISAKDRDIDFGRKMYEKFAKGIVKFLTDRTKGHNNGNKKEN